MNQNNFTNLSKELAHDIKLNMLANKTYAKVFGIGANKTGTTSLETILKCFGFNLPYQELQSASIFNQVQLGNYLALKEYIEKFDAFQDQPFSSGTTYAVVDALFPGSKFILTIREPDLWFNSLKRYVCQAFNVEAEQINEQVFDKSKYCFKGFWKASTELEVLKISDYQSVVDWSLLHNKKHYIQSYIQRNNMIIHHFRQRPNDLIVIDLTKETTTEKINDFLGIPKQYTFKMPHLNQSQ